MNNLAENLTELRKKSGLTQDELAAKIYVSRQAVSKWERGASAPDIATLTVLSEMYGVTIDDIVKASDLDSVASPKGKDCDAETEALVKAHKKELIKSMCVWGFFLFGIYALICGIIQTALFDVAPMIWIIWFTLPVVPPVLFAVKFRYEIGKKWLMFFFDMPFVSGMIFELMILNGRSDGAWISFLLIPIYYLFAIAVFYLMRKQEKKK